MILQILYMAHRGRKPPRSGYFLLHVAADFGIDCKHLTRSMSETNKQAVIEHKSTVFPFMTVARPAPALQCLSLLKPCRLNPSLLPSKYFWTLSKVKLLNFWSGFKALILIKSVALISLFSFRNFKMELSFRFPPILEQWACSRRCCSLHLVSTWHNNGS